MNEKEGRGIGCVLFPSRAVAASMVSSYSEKKHVSSDILNMVFWHFGYHLLRNTSNSCHIDNLACK